MKPGKKNGKATKSTIEPKSAIETKPVIAAQPLATAEPKEAPKSNISRSSTSTSTARPVTTIEAKIDVGFGNNLYVRGEGAGLSWEHGTPLKCVEPGTWQWSAEATTPLKCKLLLNDSVWMAGEDLVVSAGKKVEITPAF